MSVDQGDGCPRRLPAWARREALRRSNPLKTEKDIDRAIETWDNDPASWELHTCLARMIERHEKPPIDPDLVVIRRFMAERSHDKTIVNRYMNGDYDHFNSIRLALAAYKIGKASG